MNILLPTDSTYKNISAWHIIVGKQRKIENRVNFFQTQKKKFFSKIGRE